jgi:hypothetical protein
LLSIQASLCRTIYGREIECIVTLTFRSLAVISTNEDNEALSGAIAQLAEVQKNMEQIHNDQVTCDKSIKAWAPLF